MSAILNARRLAVAEAYPVPEPHATRWRRIVYVGPLVEGGTCLQRLRAFEGLGHEVIAVDTLPAPLSRLHRRLDVRLAQRLFGPFDHARVNQQLLSLAGSVTPELLWVDKGLTLEPATLRGLRARWPGTRFAAFSPDDQFNPRNQSAAWRACLPLWDVHVTTKRSNVPEFRVAGARDVRLVQKGYSRFVHAPRPVTPADVERLGGDVGFVGWPEAERERSMRFLAAHGVRVRVWGPWDRWAPRPANLRLEGRPLWGDDYARAISAFAINLCFLRKANRDRHTARSVEIPASGGFMLAERTDEHAALFEEGHEIAMFASDEELLEKVRWFLAHPQERERMADAALVRCRTSGYSYVERLGAVLESLFTEIAAPAGAPVFAEAVHPGGRY